MAKQGKYPVHPDFQHYPSFPFPFNGIVTGLLNRFLHVDTFFRQRHIMARAKKHWEASADRSYFPIYEFRPDYVPVNEVLPAVVYFHGGAFVLTYASTHVHAMAHYANEARCSVFMVDYRLAPEHPFPKGFEDCYAALEWVAREAEWLFIDEKRIAVMGDSAGGTFAAGVAQKALDEKGPALSAQVLVYPALDRHCTTRSASEYLDAPMFNGVANRKMWDVYLGHYSVEEIPAYAAPADRQDLAGLPPAYVETAEFDPLCDEGAAYAKRLQAAGVRVELHEPKGTVHGYDTVHSSSIAQDSMQRRVQFLKSAFNSAGA